MKKTFLPLHIGYILIYLLCIFISCGGIYVATIGIYALLMLKKIMSLVIIVAGVYVIYLFLFMLIYNVHNKIIFKESKLIVTGHLIKKNDGLQFPDEIRYDEIQNIAIICANANSQKKQIKNAGYSSLRPYIYYEFTLINGQTKWIFIECFSKKQRKEMLNIINDKVGLNLSYNQLERKDFSFFKNKAKR